jgi:hypothetical protein
MSMTVFLNMPACPLCLPPTGIYMYLHRKKKVREFPVPSRDVTTKLSLGGNNDVITEVFLPRGSLVSDIPAGDGKFVNLFLRCTLHVSLSASTVCPATCAPEQLSFLFDKSISMSSFFKPILLTTHQFVKFTFQCVMTTYQCVISTYTVQCALTNLTDC